MVAVGMPSASLKPVMEKILTIEPDYNRARLQLLDIFLRERNMKEVAELCRSGNDYSPSEVIYYYYGGLAELQLNHNATARQILLKLSLIHISPSGIGEVLAGIGRASSRGPSRHLPCVLPERCIASVFPNACG